MKYLLIYLCITVFLCFFGPIHFNIRNPLLLLFYISAYHLALWVGYKAACKSDIRKYPVLAPPSFSRKDKIVLKRVHFYGSGESVAYIDDLNKKDARICYCGQVSFDELQKIQRSASLLVNPRPSNESFAAYSFPSKTLSYMLSGTPVLTTRIPGIPNSYQPYLLWFDNEDTNSMAKKIEEIVSTPNENLRELGKKAFAYAKTEKNSRAQTSKLISFAEREIYE